MLLMIDTYVLYLISCINKIKCSKKCKCYIAFSISDFGVIIYPIDKYPLAFII